MPPKRRSLVEPAPSARGRARSSSPLSAQEGGGGRSSSVPPLREGSPVAARSGSSGPSRGIQVVLQRQVTCRWDIPVGDSAESWNRFDLGCTYEGDKRCCCASKVDLQDMLRPFGWQKVPRVPDLPMEASFDVTLGKPLSKFLKKSTMAREEGYVLCNWLPESAEVAPGEATTLPFGFSASKVQRLDMNVKVMVHLDELSSKGIFRLFNEVSLAPESCEVWWQISQPGERFDPQATLDVEIQSLDVDDAAFHSMDINFAFLKPHQQKSLRWMIGREVSTEPFIADWHAVRPIEWDLRESVTATSAAKDKDKSREKMPWERASVNLKDGPAALQLEYKLENRYDIHGGVLADPIGSGKTATCLSLVASGRDPLPRLQLGDWRHEYLIPLDATLVFCPENVHHQWPQEVDKWPDLAERIEVINIRNASDIKTLKLSSSQERAIVVVVPISLLESEEYAKLPSPMSSSHWKKQIWSLKQKVARNNGSSGIGLESYYWRRVIIDEFHELASTSTSHKCAQRHLRFLQSYSRWGVTGTPADLLRSVGAVQCAAKLFHCEFNAMRSARTFCEQYYRSSRVELQVQVEQKLVPVDLGGDERAIYLNYLRERGESELSPRPWDAEQLSLLMSILHLCSHFAGEDAPKELNDAASAREAAYALLYHKSGLVTRALERVTQECRHWEGCVMSAEDRWFPPGEADPARKKRRETCSACEQHTCHDCVQEAIAARPPQQDAADAMERLHKRPRDFLRDLEYFAVIWKLATRQKETIQECAICISEFPINQFTLIQCGHYFCNDCFDQAYALKKRCPMCRTPISEKGFARIKPLRMSLPVVKKVSEEEGTQSKYAKYGAKLQKIIGAMQEIKSTDAGAKVIIFTQWQSLETKIAAALAEFDITFLRLTTCKDLFERRRLIEAFQDASDGEASVLLLSLDGHASGTNLTCANHIFLVHPMIAATSEQTVAYERQAIGRAARLGQRKVVTVWRFVTVDTLEEEVANSVA
eukprot:TRINITY_DN31496_c0_g1_i1.p1 TRINITY_DN31496_c0_g1~~TRINITY_DN31496_c0_g1_i1.p1  ORF type:complete len:994 (+),score=179.38 TRINITY_DN31496_c0_g1_i1:28-3009(+)